MLWRLAASVALVLLFRADDSIAGKGSKRNGGKPVMSAVPTGAGWFCFPVENRYNVKDRSSVCVRDLEECEARRDYWMANDDTYALEFGQCGYQAKAAVFTYFDVMQDVVVAPANMSTRLCKSYRKYVVSLGEDVKSVSACALVGDLESEDEKAARELRDADNEEDSASHSAELKQAKATLKKPALLVPQGSVWWCLSGNKEADGSSLSPCFRDEAACVERADASETGTCVQKTKAFVYAYYSDGDIVPYASSTLGECNSQRTDSAGTSGVLAVSKCVPVGATGSAVSNSAVATGEDWYCSCYDAGCGVTAGACYRTEEECTAVAVDGAPKCTFVERAWVLTHKGALDGGVGPGFAAWSTFEECEDSRTTRFKKASRCEQLE